MQVAKVSDTISAIADGTILLPNGMTFDTRSLYFAIRQSGLYWERLDRCIYLNTEVAEAVRLWVEKSEVDGDGTIHGYAGLALSDYLKRMFPEKKDESQPT